MTVDANILAAAFQRQLATALGQENTRNFATVYEQDASLDLSH